MFHGLPNIVLGPSTRGGSTAKAGVVASNQSLSIQEVNMGPLHAQKLAVELHVFIVLLIMSKVTPLWISFIIQLHFLDWLKLQCF